MIFGDQVNGDPGGFHRYVQQIHELAKFFLHAREPDHTGMSLIEKMASSMATTIEMPPPRGVGVDQPQALRRSAAQRPQLVGRHRLEVGVREAEIVLGHSPAPVT